MGDKNFELGSGVLYIDGIRFGDLSECTYECDESVYKDPLGFPTNGFVIPATSEVTFTGTCTFFANRWPIIFCSNRRIVDLALYGRKKRVRNKNFNRALKLMAVK